MAWDGAQTNLSGAAATNSALRARLVSAQEANNYLQQRIDEEVLARRTVEDAAQAKAEEHVKATALLRKRIDELEDQLAVRVDTVSASLLG